MAIQEFQFLEVLKKFSKNALKVHRDKEVIELTEYTNIFWSDFWQKRSNIGQILVRFLSKLVR